MCLRGMRRQRRPRSDCADAHSDQGFRCPLSESLATIRCINGEQRPDETLRMRMRMRMLIFAMLEGTVSLDAAKIVVNISNT